MHFVTICTIFSVLALAQSQTPDCTQIQSSLSVIQTGVTTLTGLLSNISEYRCFICIFICFNVLIQFCFYYHIDTAPALVCPQIQSAANTLLLPLGLTSAFDCAKLAGNLSTVNATLANIQNQLDIAAVSGLTADGCQQLTTLLASLPGLGF